MDAAACGYAGGATRMDAVACGYAAGRGRRHRDTAFRAKQCLTVHAGKATLQRLKKEGRQVIADLTQKPGNEICDKNS